MATSKAGRQKGRRAGSLKAGRPTAVRLSHVDARGRVKMVDVGEKPVTDREAIARGSIAMSREALRLIRAGAVKKGDPLQTARLAGILAAKQTSALIPLCHPLPLSSVHVDLSPTARGYDIEARVRTTAQTGVEMEALTAVAVAALTNVQIRRPIGNLYKAGRQNGRSAGRKGRKARQGRKDRQEGMKTPDGLPTLLPFRSAFLPFCLPALR